MNKPEDEKSAQKPADARGKYEPPKLTVVSLDETGSGSGYLADGAGGYS